MYVSDWFTKENMKEWEEKDDRNKSWDACKRHFKGYHFMHKQHHDAKSTKLEELKRIEAEVIQNWEVMQVFQTKEQAEVTEQLQQLTTQNTM